ncbi:MAG: Gfo/Idh/MocA family oxidoreductase [Chthoniobacter sp.]|uniref:Gfo/Idh/MocA family protein n=1 Tax=Chthoniobacter sp. TaxID=2510640 RepID=UPI0032A25200
MNIFTRRRFLHTAALAGISAATVGRAQDAGAKPARIRIGQIGTAHAHAAGKMDTMRKSEDYEVVGVVEPDADRRAKAEQSPTYAGVPWMTEEQLLHAPGLQAVAVETLVKDLVPTGARCIAAGKHLHLDKPAGESLPAFKALLDDATRRKLTVQMGYMFRYNPAFLLCFQLLREGALGEVFSIDTAMSKLLGPAERQIALPYRGGSMFELGCHVIDAVITILGRPDKVTPHRRSVSALADGWSDNDLAVLDFPRATATVRSAMVEVEGGTRRNFVVCGTKGTFDIRPLEAPAARLALDAPHGEFKKGYQDVKFPKTGGRYDGDFADLAKVIRGEKTYAFTPEHDLATEETLLLACGLPAA